MIDRIATISELVGTLSTAGAVNKSPYLRRNNRIRTIHSSLAIENNTLTLAQVTAIINGQHVLGPPKEIREVTNAYEAYDLLLTLNPYRVEDLLKAHKIMMMDLVHESGMFRTTSVGVFAGTQIVHMAPPAELVPDQVANLLAWCKSSDVHPLIKSCVFHVEFEFIHPFVDGNGRMGRMWQTLILSKWKPLFAWIPVESLIEKYQERYYAALGDAGKTGNCTVFVEFMLEVLERSLKEIRKMRIYETVNDTVSDTVNENVFETVNLSEKERFVLMHLRNNENITIQELMKKTGYSRSTITRSLASLKEKNVVARYGSDKTGKWVVLS
ncbi:Fic family protein [Methanorbis rubei]